MRLVEDRDAKDVTARPMCDAGIKERENARLMQRRIQDVLRSNACEAARSYQTCWMRCQRDQTEDELISRCQEDQC